MNLFYYSLPIRNSLFFLDKTGELVSIIHTRLKENNIQPGQIVKTTLIIETKDAVEEETSYKSLKATLNTICNKQSPAIEILSSLHSENETALLTFAVNNTNDYTVEHKEYQKHCYTLCRSNNLKVLFSGDIHFDLRDNLHRDSQAGFDFMEQLLDKEEMHFGHIIQHSTLLGQHFLNRDSRAIIEQVKELYFNPEHFKQPFPPFSFFSGPAKGVKKQFIAASKDTFPIHRVIETNSGMFRVVSSWVNDWKQIYFSTSFEQNSSNQSHNEYKQTEKVVKLVKKAINTGNSEPEGEYKIDILNGTIDKTTDIEIIKSMIENHLPVSKIYFIQSHLTMSQAVPMLQGVVSFT